MNSSGETLNANAKYMDTIGAKAKILGATMTAMWQSMISSSAIKGLMDSLIFLAKLFGNLPVVIASLTGALVLFKGKAMLDGIVAINAYIVRQEVLMAETEGFTP